MTFVEITESEKEKEEQIRRSVVRERELHMKVVMMERAGFDLLTLTAGVERFN